MKYFEKARGNIEDYFKFILAFFGGGVVWMFLDVYVTKGIDASFVSAVMDTVLVIFACFALAEAMKVWDSRAKEDGYKIAIDLLNDKFIKTVTVAGLKDYIFHTENFLVRYHKFDGIPTNCMPIAFVKMREKQFVRELVGKRNELRSILIERIYPLSQEIQFNIFRMRNTGIDFSSNADGIKMRDHFNEFLRLSITCENYIVAMNSYFLNYLHSSEDNIEDEDSLIVKDDFIIHREKLDELKEYNKKIGNDFNIIINNLNGVTKSSNEKTVLNYFNFK